MSDLLDKIQRDLNSSRAEFDAARQSETRPRITKHGTILIGKDGVRIRDFSTDRPGDSDEWREVIVDWGLSQLRNARGLLTEPHEGLRRYTEAIRTSVRNENWFAALYLALTMPDICGALENPSSKIRNRYESWFKKYLGGLYPPDLFSASDCYYLRCSALHQGFPTHRKAQAKRFAFLAPVPNISMHCCFSKPEEGKFVLLLQVDIFCTDIVRGVERWLDDVVGQEEILKQISGMLTFMDGRSPMDLT